ncbi:MAG: alpha/beta hydrolase [Rhodoferax sp.]|nr:alpha/beta hydrolase [Rhodoferax sp.]
MQRIDLGACRLEVRQLAAPAGAPDRAPLVFLHEGLGSVAMWRDWPAQVCAASGRGGWIYSRRGYGASDPVPKVREESRVVDGVRQGRLLPDYLHHEAFEVLPALLARLGIGRAPVLLGHSDGGSIALLHASRYPVAACIVMAPHVVVEEVSLAAITKARTAFESGDLRRNLARFHSDVDCAFWQWNDAWLNPAFRGFDIRPDCQHITAPLLAIQGLDDPYGSMRQIDEICPGKGAVIRHRLLQCGHSPHRDQTAATTSLVTGFLQSVG